MARGYLSPGRIAERENNSRNVRIRRNYGSLNDKFLAETIPAEKGQTIRARRAIGRHDDQRIARALAGELGFEPRLTESESAVLPLNYSPPIRSNSQ